MRTKLMKKPARISIRRRMYLVSRGGRYGMAKAEAGGAYSFAADRAIQFHGGFGFTMIAMPSFIAAEQLWVRALWRCALSWAQNCSVNVLKVRAKTVQHI